MRRSCFVFCAFCLNCSFFTDQQRPPPLDDDFLVEEPEEFPFPSSHLLNRPVIPDVPRWVPQTNNAVLEENMDTGVKEVHHGPNDYGYVARTFEVLPVVRPGDCLFVEFRLNSFKNGACISLIPAEWKGDSSMPWSASWGNEEAVVWKEVTRKKKKKKEKSFHKCSLVFSSQNLGIKHFAGDYQSTGPVHVFGSGSTLSWLIDMRSHRNDVFLFLDDKLMSRIRLKSHRNNFVFQSSMYGPADSFLLLAPRSCPWSCDWWTTKNHFLFVAIKSQVFGMLLVNHRLARKKKKKKKGKTFFCFQF